MGIEAVSPPGYNTSMGIEEVSSRFYASGNFGLMAWCRLRRSAFKVKAGTTPVP